MNVARLYIFVHHAVSAFRFVYFGLKYMNRDRRPHAPLMVVVFRWVCDLTWFASLSCVVFLLSTAGKSWPYWCHPCVRSSVLSSAETILYKNSYSRITLRIPTASRRRFQMRLVMHNDKWTLFAMRCMTPCLICLKLFLRHTEHIWLNRRYLVKTR